MTPTLTATYRGWLFSTEQGIFSVRHRRGRLPVMSTRHLALCCDLSPHRLILSPAPALVVQLEVLYRCPIFPQSSLITIAEVSSLHLPIRSSAYPSDLISRFVLTGLLGAAACQPRHTGIVFAVFSWLVPWSAGSTHGHSPKATSAFQITPYWFAPALSRS